MIKAGIVWLIKENPEAHGVGEDTDEIRRKAYCTLRSIGQTEAYQAMGIGLNPELKVILAHDFEYQGEDLCEISNVRYKIIRAYVTEADGIELTLQRVKGNARRIPDEPEEVADDAD